MRHFQCRVLYWDGLGVDVETKLIIPFTFHLKFLDFGGKWQTTKISVHPYYSFSETQQPGSERYDCLANVTIGRAYRNDASNAKKNCDLEKKNILDLERR